MSPDVFNQMVDHLRDFVIPYQHALETEAGQRHVHLYLWTSMEDTMLAAFCSMRLDFVTICEDWLDGFTRFFVRLAWSIILAVFMVALTLGVAAAQNSAVASDSSLNALKQTLTAAVESLKDYKGNGDDIKDDLQKVRDALDMIGLRRRQAFLKEQSDALKEKLKDTQVIKSDRALIDSLNVLIDTAAEFEVLDRSQSATRRAERLLKVLETEMPWRSDPAWSGNEGLEAVLKKLEGFEDKRPIPAVQRRAVPLRTLVQKHVDSIKTSPDTLAVLVELQTQIRNVTSTVMPKVHIVSAVYGDLRDGAGYARRCDATTALVQICERADTCSISKKEPAALCGYDPAPLAEDRHKALVLIYSCVSGYDEYWNKLQQDRKAYSNYFPHFKVTLYKNSEGGVTCNSVEKSVEKKG